MKTTLSNSSIALTLVLMSACSSAPKQTQTAAVDSIPSVTDILTERMIAQLTSGAVQTIGREGLVSLIKGAGSEAGRIEMSSLVKQTANELGIVYSGVEKVNDRQATQIVNRIFRTNATVRQASLSSSNENLSNAAKRAEANSKINSNVDLSDVNTQDIARNLYEGYGKGDQATSLVHDYVVIKHVSGEDAMSGDTCTTVTKLDADAGKNVVGYYDDQAVMYKEIGQANKGLTKEQISQCTLTQGAVRSINYFVEKLHYNPADVVKALQTVETVCHIGRKGTAAKAAELLANNPSIEQLKAQESSRCN